MPDTGPFTAHEFLQDFLDEAGEHLQSMRHNLLALEASLSAGGQLPDAAFSRVAKINELYRSMHTLKGLCGMVSLAQGEQLSHQMESVLVSVKRMEVELTLPLIDALLSAAQVLDAVIAPLKDPALAAPEIGPELEKLASLLEPDRSAALPPPAVQGAVADPGLASGRDLGAAPLSGTPSTAFLGPVQAAYPEIAAALLPLELQHLASAHQAGKFISLAIFTPTSEKAARGENVNEARQQLAAQVELVKSMPLVSASGIRFAYLGFSVETPEPGRFIDMEWIHVPPAARVPFHGAVERVPVISSSVRVDLPQLDELMRLVGDLVVLRSRLASVLPRLNGATNASRDALEQTVDQMGRRLAELRQGIMRTRMVPLLEVFNHMPLAVRDLARGRGKDVRLEMSGEHTQIDKQLVERLLDPLMHLVRNAITHGIETPDVRQRLGKPPTAHLMLRGQPEGDHILVSVSDDGAGVDLEAVADKAASLGWIQPGQALTEAEALEILCRPGFTTRSQADLGSGRGLGMEIVTRFIHSVGGSLSMHSTPGHGAVFTLRLPLTLTIVDALIVQAGEERYAIQQSAVQAALELDPREIVPLETREIYPYRQGALTLFRLDRLLGLPRQHGEPGRLYALVSVEGEQRTALVVDKLLGLREVVVRTMTDPLVAQPGIIGATELGDGSTILILDLNVHLNTARVA